MSLTPNITYNDYPTRGGQNKSNALLTQIKERVLTDAELRASPVPVTGIISTGGLTDTELRASPVPVIVSGGSGTPSTLNSTDTLLNSGATFTGTWEDVSEFPSIVIAVATDQDGTYAVQFSPDGVNADSTLTIYYRTNQINVPHRFTNTRQYMRVTFTNTSAVNQTYIRLQVLKGDQTDLNISLDSTMSQDYDSISVRPTDYKYEIALGRRQGATTWNIWGFNGDLDIGTEIVGAQGGTFTFLTSASTLTIVSSSGNDDGTPAGTGANSIVIEGIDANRLRQVEVVVLNGVTPVVTITTWLGINRVSVYLAGSTFTNVGNITITATTGGTTQSFMPAGKGTSQQMVFFTQENHQFLADWLLLNVEKLSGGGSPKVQIRTWVWSAVSNCKYEVFYSLIDTSVETEHDLKPSQPFIIEERSVFWVEATSDTNNVIVTGRLSGIEFKDVNA